MDSHRVALALEEDGALLPLVLAALDVQLAAAAGVGVGVGVGVGGAAAAGLGVSGGAEAEAGGLQGGKGGAGGLQGGEVGPGGGSEVVAVDRLGLKAFVPARFRANPEEFFRSLK